MSRLRTITAGCFALTGALLVALVSRDHAHAELVLRLDAMDTSSLTLSADETDGMFSIGGFDFTDPRATGLKFVDAWGQSFGATSNSAFHPDFVPMPSADNLFRPTYNPDGLGAGLPTVNFDYESGGIVLGQGQRLHAALDNLIYSDNYSIFFVANHFGGSGTQHAFAQDLDFRQAGWSVNVTAAGRWRDTIRGTGSAAVTANSPGTVTGAAIRSIVGDPTDVIFDTVVSSGGTNTLTSQTTVPAAGRNTVLVSGGEISIGDRGGEIVGTSGPYNGAISEIAIFNTKLTVPERDAINAFLANKWLGGPAPTAGEITTATTLLQQAPPIAGATPRAAPQVVRYQFWKEGGTSDPDISILVPEVVAGGITASNFGTQAGPNPDGVTLPTGIGSSAIGIAATSLFLASEANNWHVTTEQTPANSGANFLTFTVSPDAGMEIDPSELAFTLARSDGVAPAELQTLKNAVDSFGVWINDGSGFTKVGGQVSIDGPLGATDPVDTYFDTLTVDLTSEAPFTQATEIRIYLWHDGTRPLPGDYNQNERIDAADYAAWRDNVGSSNILPNDPTPDVVDQSDYDFWKANFGNTAGEVFPGSQARVDNVRLRGDVQAAGSGLSVGVPEPTSIVLMLLGGLLALARFGRKGRGDRHS
ncbi:MAG: PEP-CTERM sorting domain-containing protein [Pirellulales bacterium]